MTDADWLKYVRSLINEPIEKFWSDLDDIEIYKQIAINIVCADFWSLLLPTHKKFESYNLEVGNGLMTLPTDCFKPVKLELVSTGQQVKYIDEDQLHLYSQVTSTTPLAWMLYDSKILLIPTPSISETDYYRLWYLPRIDKITGLPEELHPLVAIEAVIDAKTKDEDVPQHLLLKRSRLEHIARVALSVPQVQESGSIEDYEDFGDEEEW